MGVKVKERIDVRLVFVLLQGEKEKKHIIILCLFLKMKIRKKGCWKGP